MSSTYTQRIWLDGAVGPGTVPGPIVPAGQLWVVRDVQLIYDTTPYGTTVGGITLHVMPANAIFAGVGPADAVAGRLFSLELRQVLVPGDQIEAYTGDTGWSVAISGYVFNTT